MLIPILAVLAVIVVVLIAVIATRPADFRVTRKASISAHADVVFDQVNDLRKWGAWSPWEKMDATLKRTFEGPSAGEGAIYRWVGNNKVGEGSMTIIESRPDELIRIKLVFLKPFACTNAVEFQFQAEGNRTALTWSMAGKNNFMAKAVHLVMKMDKMVGGQFENGLAELQSVAEAADRRQRGEMKPAAR